MNIKIYRPKEILQNFIIAKTAINKTSLNKVLTKL